MDTALLEVHEESGRYIPHDQLFKQLIGTFFSEFIALDEKTPSSRSVSE